MRNTIKHGGFGASARLDSAFANVNHASAIASGEDFDLDLDNEDEDAEGEDDEDSEDEDSDDDEDSEDEDEGDDEDEFEDEEGDDEDSEDEDEFSDDEDSEDEDEESDADDDEFEFDAEDEGDDEDEFEDEEGDDEFADDEEADSDDEFEEDVTAFFTGSEADAGEDDEDGDEEVSEAEAIAALEAAGLCIVIATSDDEEILESDLEMAVASMEDDEFEADADEDEFEEDVTAFFTGSEANASEEDEGDDEDSEDDEDEDEFSDDEDEFEADADADEDFEDEDEGDDEDSEDDESDEDSEDEDEDEFSDDEDEEADSDDDFEHLAPVATEEFLASAGVEDVEFHVTTAGDEPVVNVMVASVPAARLTLASLGDHAAESRDIFGSDKYLGALRTAMASQGVLNLLKSAGAEFYATAYRNTDLFAEACASAESVGNERVATAMSGLREDFVDAIQLVHAGMDKNFFQMRNPLKQALFIGLAHAGVQNPAAVIETAFAEASEAHFEALVEKAVEIMDKSAEARDELRAAIGESGVIDRAGASARAATASVEIPVAQPHAGLQVVQAAAAHTATASTSVTGTVAERKSAIRTLGFGA